MVLRSRAPERLRYAHREILREQRSRGGTPRLCPGGHCLHPGNGGTVQEIFQDACQNYYKTYDDVRSPMVLLEKDYWNPVDEKPTDPKDRTKRAYPLLWKMAWEKGFEQLICLTDTVDEAVAFIKKNPPEKI